MRPESPWYNREEKHGLSIMSSIYSCPMCFHSSRELPSFMPWNATLLQQILVYDFSTFRVQFSSVTQSCLTLCDPMNCSIPGLPVHHQLLEFTQTHVHWVNEAIQASHPLSSLLLPPPILPSIRVFTNESTLRMRWPKYWSFSFSIRPSNEHPGLIS